MKSTPSLKPLLTIALLFFIQYTSFGQQSKNEFLLHGTIEGLKEGIIYLNYYLNKEGKNVKDSSSIHNGRFFFEGKLSEPMVASIRLNRTNEINDNSSYVFLEPAIMHLSLQLNKFNKAHLTGSVSQKEYESLEASKQQLRDKYKKDLDALIIETDATKSDSIQKRLAPFYADENQIDYSFFTAHPHSYITLFKLQSHIRKLPLDSFLLFYERLPIQMKENIIGKQIAERIKQIKEGSVGNRARNFNAIDLKGDSLNLSDFRGKYVLLDFWASWCVPCRKGNPHLIELYNQYNNKSFEIIGISDDDSRPDAWRKAIEKDNIHIWRHVLRGLDKKAILNGKSNDNDINKMFGISVLPTKILIDPNGFIIGRYISESMEEELDKKLAAIFK